MGQRRSAAGLAPNLAHVMAQRDLMALPSIPYALPLRRRRKLRAAGAVRYKKFVISDLTFTARSGNVCRFRFETKGENIGVTGWWKRKPSDDDQREGLAFASDALEKDGADVGRVSHALAGEGVGGKARSVEQVRRFLETGDPGVATKEFERM